MESPLCHYYTATEHLVDPGVRCFFVGAMRAPGGGAARHCHEWWVVDYNFDGVGEVKVGDGDYRRQRRAASTAHLYRPGTSYWEYISEAVSTRRSAFVIFSGGEALGLGRYVDNRYGFAAVDDADGRIGRLLAEAAPACRSAGTEGFLVAQIYLYKLASELRRIAPDGAPWRWKTGGDSALRTPQQWLDRVNAALRNAIPRRITVAEIAREVGCSVSTLTHRYRELAGESVWRSLQKYRIEAAKLFLGGGRNLAQVAALTGFCNEFHLSKCFREITGIPPSQWRRDS